jgi:hypothetical protein
VPKATAIHVQTLAEAADMRRAYTRRDLDARNGHWWTLFECRCGRYWVIRDDVIVKALICPAPEHARAS